MSSSRAFEPRQLKFKLRSCDDQIIEVEKPVALRIGMVGPMLVDTGEQDGMEIPFPTMKGPVLAKILEFCKFLCRKEDERQGEGKAREHESFENDFIKSMDRSEMLIVMEVSIVHLFWGSHRRFLRIPGLVSQLTSLNRLFCGCIDSLRKLILLMFLSL